MGGKTNHRKAGCSTVFCFWGEIEKKTSKELNSGVWLARLMIFVLGGMRRGGY